MAKSIIMNVLTSSGYEPMYPFNPALVLNATFNSTSTTNVYNLTINGVPIPLTNTFGNSMGIIAFVPTVTNESTTTISINGDTARPLLNNDGTNLLPNVLIPNSLVFVKYRNNNFYLLLDKGQIGLSNVDNTSDNDKPISTSVTNALNQKLNTPTEVPANANLNTYTTAGLYYSSNTSNIGTMTNLPANSAFTLFVEGFGGAITQTFTAISLNGVQSYKRTYNGSSFGSWQQEAFILSGTSDPSQTLGVNGNIYIKIDS